MFSLAAGGRGAFSSSNGPPGIECMSRKASIDTMTKTTTMPVTRPNKYRPMRRLAYSAQTAAPIPAVASHILMRPCGLQSIPGRASAFSGGGWDRTPTAPRRTLPPGRKAPVGRSLSPGDGPGSGSRGAGRGKCQLAALRELAAGVGDVLGDVERASRDAVAGEAWPVQRGKAVLIWLELRAFQIRPVQIGHGAVIDEHSGGIRNQQLLGILEHLDARRWVASKGGRLLDLIVELGVSPVVASATQPHAEHVERIQEVESVRDHAELDLRWLGVQRVHER